MLKPLWTPTQERIKNSQMHKFMQWLSQEQDLHFSDYERVIRHMILFLAIKLCLGQSGFRGQH